MTILAFETLVENLNLATGSPELRRPQTELKQYCDAHGLSSQEFSTLLTAITKSKHQILAGRSLRLLIPTEKVQSNQIEEILQGLSISDSSYLRSCYCRYLSALFDTDALSASAVDALHAGYGILFHFLPIEKSQLQVARLLYRITREVDVTAFRIREISKLLLKLSSNSSMKYKSSSLLALGELFDRFKPNSVIFPPRENGLPGSSGLSISSRIKLHEKVMRENPDEADLDGISFLKSLRVHALYEEEEVENQKYRPHLIERSYDRKRPRMLLLESDDFHKNTTIVLSDEFHYFHSIDQDPKESLTKEMEIALFAHLSVWDGYFKQKETLELFSKLRYPIKKSEQIQIQEKAIFPMIQLLLTCPVSFKYLASQSFAKLLSSWILNSGEESGQFVSNIFTLLDDTFFTCLTLENDHPLIQLSVLEFYLVLSKALLNRPSIFSMQPSPVKPPSEHVMFRLLLSPSIIGVSQACTVLHELLPLFHLETVTAEITKNQMKTQTSIYFEHLLQDFVKVLVLKNFQSPFNEILKIEQQQGGGEETILNAFEVIGDELGLAKSFSFIGIWKKWLQEREEQEGSAVTNERLALFLIHLKKHGVTKGVTGLITHMSKTFDELLHSRE